MLCDYFTFVNVDHFCELFRQVADSLFDRRRRGGLLNRHDLNF